MQRGTWLQRTRPERRRMSVSTQMVETARTMKIQPHAIIAFTSAWLSPDPSRQKLPNLLLQTSSMSSGCAGSMAFIDSSVRLQPGCPYACRASCDDKKQHVRHTRKSAIGTFFPNNPRYSGRSPLSRLTCRGEKAKL